MDVEELRLLAKSMGYNIIPIKKREKLLPCICGCKCRSHWESLRDGVWYKQLRCNNCGRLVLGKTDVEAIHNWNEMVRSK